MKYSILFCLIIIITSCKNVKHKTAKEIYEKGIVDDTSDWVITNNPILSRDTLRYKYDTSLFLIKGYKDGDKKIINGTMFFYRNKIEGVFSIYDYKGVLASKIHFENGKRNGMTVHYFENGLLMDKIFYRNDSSMYEVEYDYLGQIKDSTYFGTKN
jgi:antitoxin component YwqK of YwqJK toxin-antitoxin module